jgi:hypothetical protein
VKFKSASSFYCTHPGIISGKCFPVQDICVAVRWLYAQENLVFHEKFRAGVLDVVRAWYRGKGPQPIGTGDRVFGKLFLESPAFVTDLVLGTTNAE